jgi:hypothetical protein
MVALETPVRLLGVVVLTCMLTPRAEPAGIRLPAAPVITVCTLACNANGTLTAQLTATDADGELTSISGFVLRYGNLADCMADTNREATTLLIDKTSAGAATLSDTQTVACTPGKYYKLDGFAEDSALGIDHETTTCCRCQMIQQVPTLPGWALALLTVLAGALGAFLLSRK